MRKLFFLFVSLFLASNVMADQLTVSEAISRMPQVHRLAPAKGMTPRYELAFTAKQDNQNCFYVVNDLNNAGFKVLSADDCAPAVLMSIDGAQFDLAKAPVQLRGMLAHYQNVIASAIAQGKTIKKVKPQNAQNIDVMCRTTWQQAAPYNNDCTELVKNGFVSQAEQPLTGCVATAMAQCLYYFYDKFNYAAQPSGNVTYTIEYANSSNAGIKAGNLEINKTFTSADAIDYANCILMYDGFKYNATQAAAIAKLMHMAGLSLQMQYEDKTGGSGTADDNIPTAFVNNWGFDSGVQYVQREGKSDQEWTDLIFGELKAARPVMYGACGRKSDGSDGGGHEFVIDGYRTSDDLFHVNWGWENGYCNGWCYLANSDIMKVLKPVATTEGGTGTADDSNDPYANGQGAIIGIQPKGFASMAAVTPQGVNGTKSIDESTEDITNYTATEQLANVSVEYTRNFTGNWQALYVPFAIPASALEDFEVAEPNKCDGSALGASTVTSTQANNMYLIKSKTVGKKTITANNTTLEPATQATKTVGSYTLKGTSSYIPVKNWKDNYYAMGTDGKLVQTGADLTDKDSQEAAILKPHRWYLIPAAGSNAPAFIEITNEETGIVSVSTNAVVNGKYLENGKIVIVKNGVKYNVNGQQMK